MTRGYLVSLGAALALGAIGCGDNSKQCGPGTTDVDGVCTGDGSGVGTCSDGTILVGDHCEIDPNACQDGTVLVGGACVDPGHVTADVEEAAEPNGLGLFGEQSTDAAGTITLKPEGEHFVIHGKIVPFEDADGDGQQDGDVDTYVIDVTGPVTLSVSADGLHGLAGGFVSLANVATGSVLSDWVRFGVNPLGDTSSRKLYLPAAGTYLIAIADSRSLLLSGAAPAANEGDPDFEYYVTVDQVTVTPTALTATDGVATSMGTMDPGDVKLFSVEMGEGVNSAELAVTVDQVQESVLVSNTHSGASTLKAVADGDAGDGATAFASMLGVRTGDSQIVAVDSVFDYTNAPYDYNLTIKIGTAGALPTDGSDVAQPSSDVDFSVFYYDVPADQRLIGMDIAFDRPVSGVIVDQDFFIFSSFTYSPVFGTFAGDFQSYKGLLNHELPGRYYFLVFDSAGGTDDIVATSTWEVLAPAAITKGTPLVNQVPNAYESTPYTYTPGTATDPWQAFTASGSGTGAITAMYFDAGTAYGRLDPLDNDCGSLCEDAPIPAFQHTYAAAGQTRGRILMDDPTSLLVTVHTATTTGTPTFNLDFEPRAFTDLDTATVGTPITKMDQPLDGTTSVQRYLVRTGAGNGLSITADPDPTLSVTITRLAADEAALGSASGALGNAAELQSIQGSSGWTAFEVTTALNLVGTEFDLTVNATDPVTYTQSAGATTFSDACTGGVAVPLEDDDEGRSTALVNAPTGFEFFGLAVPQLRVFSNGFLSFDTGLVCPSTGGSCFFSNADIPAAGNPNGLIAPYWDDLQTVTVCRKTSGTKLIVQWEGVRWNTTTTVQFQAILDGANNTIEFVYGGSQMATGDSATIGIENQVGSAGSKVGFNTASTATGTVFTPN